MVIPSLEEIDRLLPATRIQEELAKKFAIEMDRRMAKAFTLNMFYGTSPAMDALPAIKELNKLKERQLMSNGSHLGIQRVHNGWVLNIGYGFAQSTTDFTYVATTPQQLVEMVKKWADAQHKKARKSA